MSYNKILFVDDEAIFLELIKDILADSDYTLFATSDTDTALEILKHEKIDILMTDLKMPKRSGIELAREARLYLPNLQVVLMTGMLELPDCEETQNNMLKYHLLSKPFSIDAMVRLLTAITV
ncbi:MAG: response regulator [Candidatus Auribacterota bacterium]|jgi:DNA-binding NtrC family response regulator